MPIYITIQKKNFIQKVKPKVRQVTEPKVGWTKDMKLYENPKKRTQHSEMNPAVGTKMKPEPKVNYVRQTRVEKFL